MGIETPALRISKTSPGLVLVMLGFLLVYFFGFRHPVQAPVFLDYLPFVFGFLLSAAGIAIITMDFRRGGAVVEQTITSSDLDITVGQLAKNFDILRAQTTQGFLVAVVLMIFGVLIILAGAAGELFGFTRPGSNLTTVAGIIIDVVSGIGLYLFRSTFNRLNSISDSLLDTWKVLAAFKKANDLPDDKRPEVQAKLIERLITPHFSTVMLEEPEKSGKVAIQQIHPRR